jgi:aspartyl protease family protein
MLRRRWPPVPAQGAKSADPGPTAAVPLPTILRPGPSTHTLVYRTGPLGHVVVTASVNGAPIRFLVDTGASTVTLSPADARAAGINPSALAFDKTTTTANGVVRVAPVMLREIRIEQLAVENVPAVVDANLSGLLLGMSFLSRLKSFAMRGGALTFTR